MNKKRTAAPVCKTEDGEGQIVMEGFELPNSDFITSWKPKQGTIAFLLLRGMANAQTATELSAITGDDRRSITERIQRERLEGSPVLSCVNGYYLPESPEDLQRCVISLWSRIREQIATVKSLQRIGMEEK